jgi:tRNA(Ile)-lysidine synthase
MNNIFYDEDKILPIISSYISNINTDKILVSVSGGVDSMFLAIATHLWSIDKACDVKYLTINHNLRPNSHEEARNTSDILIKYGIKQNNIIIYDWVHDSIPSSAIEEKARNKRREIVKEICNNHDIQNVLLGHHLDDQIETLIMNISRGSGIFGASCMPYTKETDGIKYHRPMLDTRKSAIINFMKTNNIKWFEDYTNHETDFTRNKIRKTLSEIKIDDTIANRINNFIKINQDTRNMIKEITIRNYNNIVIKNNNISINRDKFYQITKQERYYLIKCILEIDCNMKEIRDEYIQNIITDINSKSDQIYIIKQY